MANKCLIQKLILKIKTEEWGEDVLPSFLF